MNEILPIPAKRESLFTIYLTFSTVGRFSERDKVQAHLGHVKSVNLMSLETLRRYVPTLGWEKLKSTETLDKGGICIGWCITLERHPLGKAAKTNVTQ